MEQRNLMGRNGTCNMSDANDRLQTILRLSKGMDELSTEQRDKSISFANAMTALGGTPVSRETAADIAAWRNGTKSYLSVFLDTLRRYGITFDDIPSDEIPTEPFDK